MTYRFCHQKGHNQRTCGWKKLAESGLQDGAFDMEAEAEAEELTQGDEFPHASLFSASQPQSQPQSQMSATTSKGARKGTKEAASSNYEARMSYKRDRQPVEG
ncbi:DNA-directed RNA polymerase subunit beta [Striga asiatica]|uniref:DNA-directed RNA polymerase subunit beta n=1 Tax=Striga asiatica TaxID=4170 RepID=A0A5A7R3J5_STRAF|nr:DNA-directed RNA polymerase subunit beta [Striga asiatica]